MAHVIKTLQDNLSAETDPFYGSFGTPPVLAKLIELGNLGQKAKKGFYKKGLVHVACGLGNALQVDGRVVEAVAQDGPQEAALRALGIAQQLQALGRGPM